MDKKQLINTAIIIALIIALVFSVSRWNKANQEKDDVIRQQNTSDTINEVEKNNTEIIYREEKIYPKIDERLKNIEKSIKENQKKVSDEVKATNINDMRRMYRQLGYSSTIIRN